MNKLFQCIFVWFCFIIARGRGWVMLPMVAMPIDDGIQFSLAENYPSVCFRSFWSLGLAVTPGHTQNMLVNQNIYIRDVFIYQ